MIWSVCALPWLCYSLSWRLVSGSGKRMRRCQQHIRCAAEVWPLRAEAGHSLVPRTHPRSWGRPWDSRQAPSVHTMASGGCWMSGLQSPSASSILDQSEARAEVTWPGLTNRRPESTSLSASRQSEHWTSADTRPSPDGAQLTAWPRPEAGP